MIVEFDIDSDVLSHAVRRTPDTSVVVERLDASDDVPLRNVFWVTSDDFEAFDEALTEDPTVRSTKCLTETDDARLYRVHYDESAPEVEAYRALVGLDGVMLGAENDGDGWRVRMQFPDRNAIAEFCDRCWNAGFDLQIRAIYDRHDEQPKQRDELTDIQRETLVTALETGYFSIPRDASLQDVADLLGVSAQATSERLRRGLATLVQSTLGESDEEESDHLDVEQTE